MTTEELWLEFTEHLRALGQIAIEQSKRTDKSIESTQWFLAAASGRLDAAERTFAKIQGGEEAGWLHKSLASKMDELRNSAYTVACLAMANGRSSCLRESLEGLRAQLCDAVDVVWRIHGAE